MVGGQEDGEDEDGKYVCLLEEPHAGNNEKRRNAFVQSISRLEYPTYIQVLVEITRKQLKQSILNLADHGIDYLSAK